MAVQDQAPTVFKLIIVCFISALCDKYVESVDHILRSCSVIAQSQ